MLMAMKSIDSEHYLHSAELNREKFSSVDKYLRQLPVVKHFTQMEFGPGITFIVGENGSGKSTLLEALAIGMGLNPEGGSKNFNFSTHSNHSQLYTALELKKGIRRPKDWYFLRAESFYNLASQIQHLDEDPWPGSKIIYNYGGVSLHEQSHGESFMALLDNRLGGEGLYFFDEPEAALSPMRQMEMMARLKVLLAKKSQFIIATHSPILLAYPGSAIYEIRQGKLKAVQYEETQHYQVSKGFLNNYQSVLSDLLD